MSKDLCQHKAIPILEVAQRLRLEVDRNKQAHCFNGHDSKTPSLSFKPDKNYFRCFSSSCNIKGSAIDLVKEYKQ